MNQAPATRLFSEPVQPPPRELARRQVSLHALFVVLTLVCIVTAVATALGLSWWQQFFHRLLAVFGLLVPTVLVLVPFSLCWGYCYRLMPEATKHATVFGILFFLLLAPLPCYLLHSREAAKRAVVIVNIRQLGHPIHAFDNAYPHGRGEIITGRDRYESLINWTIAEEIAQDEYLSFPPANGRLHEP